MDNPNLRVTEQNGYLLLIGTLFDHERDEAVTVTRALDVEDEVNQLSVLVAYERIERRLGTSLWPLVLHSHSEGNEPFPGCPACHNYACSPLCEGDHPPVEDR